MPSNREFGVNSAAVIAFLDRLRGLTARDGAAIRGAYLDQAAADGLGGPSAQRRAAVLSRLIGEAVRTGRREAHTAAVQAGLAAVGASGAKDEGVGVFLADLAGALVVRDLIRDEDFDLMAGGWLVAMGPLD